MAELVLNTVLGGNSGSVATTDDDNLAVLDTGNGSVESGLGTSSELVKLKDTSGAVPQDGLGLINGLLEESDGLLTAVETHPAVGNTVGIGGVASVSILVELVGSDVVNGQDELDVLGLGLLNQASNGLGTSLVEEGVTNGDVVEGLLEGESHTTADDEGVDLVQEVVNELDLVSDLGTTEDGEERTLRRLESLGKVVELLLHEETGSLLGQIDTDHGGVSTVSSAESIVDEDVTESGQALAELINLGLVSLGLVAISILGAALFLNVETQVLEEDDGTVVSLVDDGLDLGADAVGGESNALAKQLLELRNDGLERVLGVHGTIGTSKVRHEDDRLGAVVESMLDGGDGTDNALVVGDVLVLVEGNVEVDLDGKKGISKKEIEDRV